MEGTGRADGGRWHACQECPALHRHNADWSRRWRLWLEKGDWAPWWAEGCILSPEMRGHYEAWLPWEAFRRSLASVCRMWLPQRIAAATAEWTPGMLQGDEELFSLPDFWQKIRSGLAGRVCFAEEELLPLFCAMADPPRFGTDSGRYPEQNAVFRQILQDIPRPVTFLDVGCGVGLNTWELASIAAAAPSGLADAWGITAEPLEAWMASRRRLPHDPLRQRRYMAFPAGLPVHFQAGRAEELSLDTAVDFLFCNGVVGGRFMNTRGQYEAFLHGVLRVLRPGGWLFCADHFHAGCRGTQNEFSGLAEQAGLQPLACSRNGDMAFRRKALHQL